MVCEQWLHSEGVSLNQSALIAFIIPFQVADTIPSMGTYYTCTCMCENLTSGVCTFVCVCVCVCVCVYLCVCVCTGEGC